MKDQGISAEQKEVLKAILPKMTSSVFGKVDRCIDMHNKRQKVVVPPSPQLEPEDPSLPEEVKKLEKEVDDLEEAVQNYRETIPQIASERAYERLKILEQHYKDSPLKVAKSASAEEEEERRQRLEHLKGKFEKFSHTMTSMTTEVPITLQKSQTTLTHVERALANCNTETDTLISRPVAAPKPATKLDKQGDQVQVSPRSTLRQRLAHGLGV
jgi:chromosome segregation ATPase